METPEQREERIRRLEQGRRGRQAQTNWWQWPNPGFCPGPFDPPPPVEVAPGRGDLNYSSWNTSWMMPTPTALQLIPYGWISYAQIFQTQPWVAAAVMRMLTWAIRVPLKCYRRGSRPNDRERLRYGDHPIATMIGDPWKGGSAARLVMNLLGPILVHGNSVT